VGGGIDRVEPTRGLNRRPGNYEFTIVSFSSLTSFLCSDAWYTRAYECIHIAFWDITGTLPERDNLAWRGERRSERTRFLPSIIRRAECWRSFEHHVSTATRPRSKRTHASRPRHVSVPRVATKQVPKHLAAPRNMMIPAVPSTAFMVVLPPIAW
jgi:hypothetical protein